MKKTLYITWEELVSVNAEFNKEDLTHYEEEFRALFRQQGISLKNSDDFVRWIDSSGSYNDLRALLRGDEDSLAILNDATDNEDFDDIHNGTIGTVNIFLGLYKGNKKSLVDKIVKNCYE